VKEVVADLVIQLDN